MEINNLKRVRDNLQREVSNLINLNEGRISLILLNNNPVLKGYLIGYS